MKATAASTGGALTVMESVLSQDQGPPRHVHAHEDECFRVIEGMVNGTCGDEAFEAPAGSFVFLPRGLAHAFRAVAGEARLLLIAVPGGIEHYFGEINNAVTTAEQERIGDKYEIRIVLPVPCLFLLNVEAGLIGCVQCPWTSPATGSTLRTGQEIGGKMDPLTVSFLLVKFAGSFADRAGSRSADLVFDYLARRPDAKADPVKSIEASVKTEPGFGDLVSDAVNGDILSFTVDAAKIVYSEPGILQSFLGISEAQATFNTRGRCPVGGEVIIIPPAYLMPDGTSVSPATIFPLMKKKSVLMRARCRRGHEWLVFPVSV